MDMFSIFFIIKVCCVFSILMGTYKITFSIHIKKKITLNYPKSAEWGFILGIQELVRNSVVNEPSV